MTRGPEGTRPGGVTRAGAFPVILAGPSGAGKTTICGRLTSGPDGERFLFSVSMTTRSPRPGERDGVDYRFVERAAFADLVERGAMLEHATVHGELYGTPASNLEEARSRNAHLLLDIDVQGARQVRAAVPDALSIFLVPPTGERIAERLRARGSETAEQLGRRIAGALAELEAADEFDYLVVNDVLDEAVELVRSIVAAEGASIRRAPSAARALVGRVARQLDTA